MRGARRGVVGPCRSSLHPNERAAMAAGHSAGDDDTDDSTHVQRVCLLACLQVLLLALGVVAVTGAFLHLHAECDEPIVPVMVSFGVFCIVIDLHQVYLNQTGASSSSSNSATAAAHRLFTWLLRASGAGLYLTLNVVSWRASECDATLRSWSVTTLVFSYCIALPLLLGAWQLLQGEPQ